MDFKFNVKYTGVILNIGNKQYKNNYHPKK